MDIQEKCKNVLKASFNCLLENTYDEETDDFYADFETVCPTEMSELTDCFGGGYMAHDPFPLYGVGPKNYAFARFGGFTKTMDTFGYIMIPKLSGTKVGLASQWHLSFLP